MKIRLTEWATQQNVCYLTAYRWARQGRVPGLYTSPSGRLYVEVDQTVGKKTVLYGRVSSHDQKKDLQRQLSRLQDFAAAKGLVVDRTVSEIGSGLNGHRNKLLTILKDVSVGTIVIEHRDRLARFGVEYVEAALQARGAVLLVINSGEEKLDLVQDFVDVVTSMCASIYGRRSAANRAAKALEAARK